MALPHFAERDRGERWMAAAVPPVDDGGMDVIPLNPAVEADATLRCECGRCGTHVVVRRSWQITGQCGNCRSYDLRALVAAVPPATPPAVVDPPAPLAVAFPTARVA
jgi:hypothetical protein